MQKPNLFQKIMNWINDKIELYKSDNKEQTKFLQDIKKKFELAYRQMNTDGLYNTTKYHVSDNALSDINSLLQGKYDTSQNIKLRDYTPKSLVDIGLKDLPMLMNSNHVLSNILTEQDAKNIGKYNDKNNYHGLGVKKFLETIDSLDNLEKVFKHKNGKDYIVLTTQYDSNGNKIISPTYVEDKGKYNYVNINPTR